MDIIQTLTSEFSLQKWQVENTIKLLHKADKDITVIVGGAVLTEEYAAMIKADCYAKDAMETVRFAEKFYS